MLGVFILTSDLSLFMKSVCEMLKLKALEFSLVVGYLLMREWERLRSKLESELQNGYGSVSIASLYRGRNLSYHSRLVYCVP